MRWVMVVLLFLGMGMAGYDWFSAQGQPAPATAPDVTAAEDGTGWPPRP